MVYYTTRIWIRSEVNDFNQYGIGQRGPLRSLSIEVGLADRKAAHIIVDEYFDEFEKMVECPNPK